MLSTPGKSTKLLQNQAPKLKISPWGHFRMPDGAAWESETRNKNQILKQQKITFLKALGPVKNGPNCVACPVWDPERTDIFIVARRSKK